MRYYLMRLIDEKGELTDNYDIIMPDGRAFPTDAEELGRTSGMLGVILEIKNMEWYEEDLESYGLRYQDEPVLVLDLMVD